MSGLAAIGTRALRACVRFAVSSLCLTCCAKAWTIVVSGHMRVGATLIANHALDLRLYLFTMTFHFGQRPFQTPLIASQRPLDTPLMYSDAAAFLRPLIDSRDACDPRTVASARLAPVILASPITDWASASRDLRTRMRCVPTAIHPTTNRIGKKLGIQKLIF